MKFNIDYRAEGKWNHFFIKDTAIVFACERVKREYPEIEFKIGAAYCVLITLENPHNPEYTSKKVRHTGLSVIFESKNRYVTRAFTDDCFRRAGIKIPADNYLINHLTFWTSIREIS
jgi:hypothetical protein